MLDEYWRYVLLKNVTNKFAYRSEFNNVSSTAFTHVTG